MQLVQISKNMIQHICKKWVNSLSQVFIDLYEDYSMSLCLQWYSTGTKSKYNYVNNASNEMDESLLHKQKSKNSDADCWDRIQTTPISYDQRLFHLWDKYISNMKRKVMWSNESITLSSHEPTSAINKSTIATLLHNHVENYPQTPPCTAMTQSQLSILQSKGSITDLPELKEQKFVICYNHLTSLINYVYLWQNIIANIWHKYATKISLLTKVFFTLVCQESYFSTLLFGINIFCYLKNWIWLELQQGVLSLSIQPFAWFQNVIEYFELYKSTAYVSYNSTSMTFTP